MAVSGWVKKKGRRQGLWHRGFLSISGNFLTISKDYRLQAVEQHISPLSPEAVTEYPDSATVIRTIPRLAANLQDHIPNDYSVAKHFVFIHPLQDRIPRDLPL
jgi:hypothetical protein